MTTLPKKRAMAQQSRPSAGSVLHDLSAKGRVISERVLSNSKRKPSGTRHVSRGDMFVARDDDDANMSFGEDAIHFHENKTTIMSNFEEWIKLSTDNKITLKNSWQFALIDYFHDLNVIKDGDNINFQRASATLDGCVKIYSSRVESAASETGKLLSGLATKKGQMELENNASDNEQSDADADVEQVQGKKERRINRVVDSTLVPFSSIQIKKLDQELAIDPLFKKALADFDEGGAKSLLLNTLNIDESGRVVFDATTNPAKPTAPEELPTSQPASTSLPDLSGLRKLLFKDSSDLSGLSICPSITELKAVLNDVNKAKSILSDVNSKFTEDTKEPTVEPEATPLLPDGDFDFDIDNDIPERLDEPEFQEQNIAQTYEQYPVEEVITTERVLDQDLMAYFDEKMKTNWRGPEHWKVAALKKSKKLESSPELTRNDKDSASNPEAPKRKRKEQIMIDFFQEDDPDYIEDIFQRPKNQFQISKKPEERNTTDFFKLPDDIQFNSQKLVNLFLKPNKSIVTFTSRQKPYQQAHNDEPHAETTYTDERYFAERYLEKERERQEGERQERLAVSFHQAEMEDYDNDTYGGVDFNDVLGNEKDLQNVEEDKKDDVGSQFVTGGRKARPEYVNFSRVAKRIDIKLLKDNLWNSIKAEDKEEEEKEDAAAEPVVKEKTFREVVDNIGQMYRPEEKKDLSTSFCFICILHLANEHGLSIESNAKHDNLVIKGF